MFFTDVYQAYEMIRILYLKALFTGRKKSRVLDPWNVHVQEERTVHTVCEVIASVCLPKDGWFVIKLHRP